MFKLLVFTIVLSSSPTFGLLDVLLNAERNCYSGCTSNYAASFPKIEACKTGCSTKLQSGNCPEQCKSLSTDEQIQASCLVGCSMFASQMKEPVQNVRQQSIILERLRQTSAAQVLFPNAETSKILHDMIITLKANSPTIDASHNPSKFGDSNPTLRFSETIPLSDLPVEIRSELTNSKNGNVVRHLVIYEEDEIYWLHDRLQNIFSYVRDKWSALFGKQSAMLIWIIHSIFLFSSLTLCYMMISLCRHAPTHRVLSVHSQELAFDDALEKEKLQSNDMLQSSFVKIK